MLRKIGFAVVGLSIIASPFIASADTGSDIQAKIQALLAQISAIQKQIADLTAASNPVACTADAKQCPDGSYVGRSGPHCEFAACGGTGTATPAMPSRVCPQILRPLSLGSTGDDVSSLQTYLDVPPTGYFGPMTMSAVTDFQASEGLAQVGIVGPQTRSAFARRCGNPNKNFSASPTSGSAPLTVNFSAAVPSHYTSDYYPYTVDFGDGASATMQLQGFEQMSLVANHTYAQAGTYTAKLRSSGGPTTGACNGIANPNCDVIGTVTITVSNCPPNADNCNFRTSAPSISGVDGPTTLAVGQSGTWNVHVTDSSGYLSYSVRWGDEPSTLIWNGTASSPAVASSGTFTHTYATAGTYSPTFTVTNGNGQSASASATVQVGGTTNPTFSASPTSGQAPLSVEFSVSDGPQSNSYLIAFGDGTQGQVQATPVPCAFTGPCPFRGKANHTYTSASTYTAKLYSYDNGISYDCPLNVNCLPPGAILVSTATITVSGSTNSGTLSASPTSGAAPLAVHFATTNMTMSPASILDWYTVDFGDGTSGYLALSGCNGSIGCVDHTYAQNGTYTARIVHHPDPSANCPTTNGTYCGSTLTFNTVTITVSGTQQSVFSAAPTSGSAPLAVTFSGNAGVGCNGGNFILAYGDGQTDMVAIPADSCNGGFVQHHTYTSAGTYTATLSLYIACLYSTPRCMVAQPAPIGSVTISVR